MPLCACSRGRVTTRRASATSPRKRVSRTVCSTTTSPPRKRCSRRSSARRGATCSQPFAAIERIVRRGQADGEFREELDARLASVIFYGAIEEVLTGWVLELLPDGDAEVARAEETVIEIVAGGAPARRQPQREERDRTTAAELRARPDLIELPIGEVERAVRTTPADTHVRSPRGAHLRLACAEAKPGEALSGDEDALLWQGQRGGERDGEHGAQGRTRT